MRRAALLFACGLAACAPSAPPDPLAGQRPMRVVSLDYCADQFVLKLVERERILAVSPHAGRDFSYMREAAAGVPTVRPSAEDVLALQPDLVVRAYGGGPRATAFFEAADVPVVQIGWAGSLEAVMINVETVGAALGEAEKGRSLSAQMRGRLEALETSKAGQSALYVTPGGATTGPGGLFDEMLTASGMTNFVAKPNWQALPLEALSIEQPDRYVYAQFSGASGQWSSARHPILRRGMASGEVIEIEGAMTSCGGWFLMDAIEAIASGQSQ